MSEPKVEDTEEVIEEIGVEDGSDPSYQLDPGMAYYCITSQACQDVKVFDLSELFDTLVSHLPYNSYASLQVSQVRHPT